MLPKILEWEQGYTRLYSLYGSNFSNNRKDLVQLEKSNTERGGRKEPPPLDKFIHFLIDRLEELVSDLPDIESPNDTEESDYEILFECKVAPDTYARDLYITPLKGNGKKMHHSEWIAEGAFTQEAFDESVAAKEQEISKLPEYKENNYFVIPLR